MSEELQFSFYEARISLYGMAAVCFTFICKLQAHLLNQQIIIIGYTLSIFVLA